MNKKGQTTLEAVVVIMLVVAAWLVMQGYLRRAVQANWKTNADSFSDEQFEPGLSQETVSKNQFISPTIGAGVGINNTTEGTLYAGSGAVSGTIQLDHDTKGVYRITNWGTYKGVGEDDEEEW